MKSKGFAPMKSKISSPMGGSKKTNMDYGKLPAMKTDGMKTTEAVDTTAINLGEEGMFTKSGAFNAGLAAGRKWKGNAGKRAKRKSDRQSKSVDRKIKRSDKKDARKSSAASNRNYKKDLKAAKK